MVMHKALEGIATTLRMQVRSLVSMDRTTSMGTLAAEPRSTHSASKVHTELRSHRERQVRMACTLPNTATHATNSQSRMRALYRSTVSGM